MFLSSRNSFLLIIVAAFFAPGTLLSQSTLGLQFSQNATGKNLRLSIGYYTGPKSQLFGGLKYHFNNPNALDSRMYAYWFRFHAEKPFEHFGLFHRVQVPIFEKKIAPGSIYLFNNLDFNYLGYKQLYYMGNEDYDTLGNQTFQEVTSQHPPILSIEAVIGLGIDAPVSRKLSLTCQTGYGLMYIRDYTYLYTDPKGNTVLTFASPGFEYTFQLSVGLIYKLGKL